MDGHSIYLAFRGGNGIQSVFAKRFNICDTTYSHVGVLFYDNKKWSIANITPLNDYVINNYKDFYKDENGKLMTGSIWRIEGLTQNDIRKIKGRIYGLQNDCLCFDRSFNLNNDKYYCSELTAKILGDSILKRINVRPIKVPLKPLYKAYFRSDSLLYYPVDGFQNSKDVKEITYW